MSMNKFCLLSIVTCICLSSVFTSCKKDDDGPGTSAVSSLIAKVEGGSAYNSKVDVVKVLLNIDETYDSKTQEYIWVGDEVASGSYADGGFTIDLPETVSSKYLSTLYAPDGINISDTKAQVGMSGFLIGYKSGVEVGEFVYAKVNGDDVEPTGMFFYADRDVTMTGSASEKDGSYTDNYSFNVSFKKGWNIVYASYDESKDGKTTTYSLTTSDPGNMKWYFGGVKKSYQAESVAKSVGYKQKMSSIFKALEIR